MSERRAALRHGELAVEFCLASGSFALQAGGFRLSSLRPALVLPDREIAGEQLLWRVVSNDGGRLRVAGTAEGLCLDLAFSVSSLPISGRDLPVLTLEARVASDAPFSLERIVFFQGGRAPAPEWIYSLALRDFPMGSTRVTEGLAFKSASVTGWTRGGHTLFLTFPLRQSLPCAVGGQIAAGQATELQSDCLVHLDGVSEVVAPPLTLGVTDMPHAYLEAHGDRQREDVMPPLLPRPIAWNSWDYIRDLVSEDYVLRNLDCIANDPVLRRHVEYIVVDSGWEFRYGDWTPNPRFPHGMEWLAQQIIARGFKAGLWLAPPILENCSTPALWNTELLAHGRARVPCQAYQCMLRYGFVLDIKKPEARRWLHDVFARYRAMGYTYFKTDFLRHIKHAVFFSGQRVAEGDLVREVLEVVREAIGAEAHLVGCNYPDETGCGLINSNRVSGDIAPHWETVHLNARSHAAQYWMHGRVWCNDPDFAICRGPETSDDPDLDRMHAGDIYVRPDQAQVRRLPYLSAVEARTLLSLVILTGGSVTLSDNLPRLNETGLELLRRTVSAEAGTDMRPLDLFAADVPSLWLQRVGEDARRLGVVNWSDEPVLRTLDLPSLTGRAWRQAHDFWTGERIATGDTEVAIHLAPHETKLLVRSDQILSRGK